jgi:hypothetical protein
MPKRTKTRAPRAAARHPYIGGQRFESINDPATGTNDEHVKMLLQELPYMRVACFILNSSDRDLEARMRGANEEALSDFLGLAEALVPIQKRHEAAVSICKDAAARVLVICDRLTRGPQEVAHA